MKIKNKLLIVGAFPKNKNQDIYGGQLTACNSLIDSYLSDKYEIFTIDSTTLSIPPPNLLIRAFYANKRLYTFFLKLIINKPKVVIIFVADKYSAIEKGIMILISKLFNIPVMLFPRAGALIKQYKTNQHFKSFLNFTFKKSKIFLCQGSSFQKFAIQELSFTKDKCPIIPNWTANKSYLQIGEKRKFSNFQNNLNILFIGWLEDFKGIKEILQALKILKNKKYKFHFYFAGDGQLMSYAKNFVESFELERHATFLGWINEEKKIELLSKSNIFILPSWNEGLPNAMIEAMSAGLACIVSGVGMIPDYAEHGNNSLIVKPKSSEEIVLSIEKLLKDFKFREKISKNAYFFARENFSEENGIKLLDNEVKKLIALN